MNVRWFSRKRDPAERTASFAKKGTNIRGYEAGEGIGILYTLLERERANVVAVIESDRAHFLQTQHAFDVAGDCVQRFFFVASRVALS